MLRIYTQYKNLPKKYLKIWKFLNEINSLAAKLENFGLGGATC